MKTKADLDWEDKKQRLADSLGLLWKLEELGGHVKMVDVFHGTDCDHARFRDLVERLLAAGLIRKGVSKLRITRKGRELAQRVARTLMPKEEGGQ